MRSKQRRKPPGSKPFFSVTCLPSAKRPKSIGMCNVNAYYMLLTQDSLSRKKDRIESPFVGKNQRAFIRLMAGRSILGLLNLPTRASPARYVAAATKDDSAANPRPIAPFPARRPPPPSAAGKASRQETHR